MINCLRNIFYCLLIMFFISSCNKSRINRPFNQQRQKQIHISKRITQGKLDNGLKFFYMRNKSPHQRCFIRLHVAVGSFMETDEESGMAHMVEHLAFDNRKVSHDISLVEWFQKQGMSFGPDANAYTSNESTVYKINLQNCEESALRDALKIFRGFADGLTFSEEAILKEKNVIDAEEIEYKNSYDELSERITDHLYSGTLLVSRKVLGNAKVRKNFTKEALTSFYEKWYHPNNLSLVLVGDYGDIKPAMLIKEIFTDLSPKSPVPKAIKSSDPDYKTPAFVLHEKEMKHNNVVFTVQKKQFIKPRYSKQLIKDRLAFKLAIQMLNNSFSIRAQMDNNQLYKPLINGFMYDNDVYELTLKTAGSPDNFEATFKDAFLTLRRAAMYGFLEDEFNKARRALMDDIHQWVIEESTVSSLNWAEGIVNHIDKNTYANDARSYQAWARPYLAAITAQDCQQALDNALKSGHHFIFAVGAMEENIENVNRVKKLLDEAKGQKIEPENKKTSLSFKYAQPSSIRPKFTKKRINSVNAHQITFSNGLKALIKPTSFKKDEVLLLISSNEGYAHMDKRDYVLAMMAQALLGEGGLNKHPPEEIPHLLLDKHLSIQFNVFDDSIEARAVSRKKDLRFALEFLKAFITDPMYAETSLNRLKERLKINYSEIVHDIWAPINHDFIKAISNDDFHLGRIPLDDLLSVTRDELLVWHKKYIGSSKINIVAVGDFDSTYMAREIAGIFQDFSFKTTKSIAKETPSISFKPGINKVYQVDTKDESSKISLRYPLNYTARKCEDFRLVVLNNILSEFLRLKLREKKQITYFPAVNITQNRSNFFQNSINITLSVKKDDAEKTCENVKKTLEKLAIKGITEQDLLKAKEPVLANLKNLYQNNSYWLNNLSNNFDDIDRASWISNLSTDISKIKVNDINVLLQKYTRTTNVSTAIVHADKG
jgi:zinc protease